MITVYVLKSSIANKSYVGLTSNIDRRLEQHNSEQNYYTKRYSPWYIVHTEQFLSVQEARKREKFLKSTSGRRVMKKLFEGR